MSPKPNKYGGREPVTAATHLSHVPRSFPSTPLPLVPELSLLFCPYYCTVERCGHREAKGWGLRGAELLQIGCQAKTQRCTHLWERESPFVQSSQSEGRGSLWGSLHSVLKVTLRRCCNYPFYRGGNLGQDPSAVKWPHNSSATSPLPPLSDCDQADGVEWKRKEA